jgi:NTP pyrophosphatase (non-canonical NTP hydrolase)
MQSKEREARERAARLVLSGETDVTRGQVMAWSTDDLYEWLEVGWGLYWNGDLWIEEPDANEYVYSLRDYQQEADGTSRYSGEAGSKRLLMGAMGAASESGELLNIIKKWLFHDHDFDRQKVVEELGDVLWYVAECSSALGLSLDELALFNIEKLRRRYGAGFDSEASRNREA